MAKVVHDEKINDLSTPWEGYTGQRVEELIKTYLSDHDQKKVGYMLLPKAIESDGYYHIKCFASEETYNLWLEDENLHNDLLLFNLAIPLVENNGTTYAARLSTSLVTSDPIIVTEKNYNVPVMFKGTMSSGGITENAGIRGNVTIQRSTDGGSTWETVGGTTLNSIDPEATSYTDINIGQYFSESNPQQIRLRASYTVYDDEGLVVASAQSAWLTFSNITYTNLTISFAGNFENPIDGATASGFPLAYNLSGEISRKLHIKISGARGTLDITRTIGANEYTNALTTWRDTVPDSDSYQILSHGIHTIEAWLTYSDEVNDESISSPHIINQLLVINRNTVGADLTKSWLMVQNVAPTAVNYVAMSEFLKFAVWVPSAEDPFIASENKISVAFVLTDYGTDGSDWNTEYFRTEQVVSSGTQYTLPATIEIENSIDNELYGYLHVQDGDGGDFLYASCGRYNYQVIVDNKEKFSPTAGVKFFLNPKNRNNSESNPFSIINAATGEEVEATFSDNFGAINDLWVTSTVDNQKVLRVKAGQKLEINYDWLAPFRTITAANVTFEIDFKVDNVTDEETPIIQAIDALTSSVIGLKMFPMTGYIYSRNHITDEAQDFRWQEGKRTHIAINIVSALHPTADSTTTLPLCRVFINGVINREFIFGSWNDGTKSYDISAGEWYQNGSKLVFGQDAADLDIYSIRCYQDELSSSNILQDYISTLPTSDEKISVRNKNAILGSNGLISASSLMTQGKNVLIWHGTQPDYNNNNVGTGWWEIHIYNSDGSEDLEHSGTICKGTASLVPTSQGSTAKTYRYHNIQTKLKDVENTIEVAVEKIHPEISWKDVLCRYDSDEGEWVEDPAGDTQMCYIKGNALKGYFEWVTRGKVVRVTDGWIDGNDMYRGNSYQIEDASPISQKLVLKINYASCMQSHLMGNCKMYNDLHTKIVGTNTLQKDNPKARVAKIQAPFHYFTQGLGDSVSVYQGPGTFGPGKMDDYTWGFDKKKHTNFCMIEGADNNLPLTDFRIPWQSSRIFCEEEDGEVVGWIYNRSVSFDLDKCVTVKRSVPVQISTGENTYETVYKTLKTVSETVEGKIKSLVNFLYKHNTKIEVYIGTFDDFKSKYEEGGSTINTNTSYWCTSGSDAYCLKRFDHVDQAWVNAGWDEETETVIQRNLYTEFPEAVDSRPGQWTEINKAFISAIATDARDNETDNFGHHFKVDSALFHYAFINQFMAGTDNCSKNTYYVLDPGTLLWEMHQDDMDTTMATDNSGFQSKPYYIDRQNPYPENSNKTCYEGGYNVLFNLIEAMYENHGEIRSMMGRVFTEMCGLIKNEDLSNGITATPWGALQKYFFSTQDYFSATAYNEAARIRYEYPSVEGFISARGVNPITQSMGDQVEAEKQYMKRRLVLFASYAEWGGDFSKSTVGNTGLDDTTTNFGIEATKDIDGNNTNVIFNLVPHQYIYPTGAVGQTTSYLRKRCKPGETYTFQINSSPVVGDTAVVLFASNYYRSLGNLGDLSVLGTRDMTITGKRLVEFKATPSNPDKPHFRPNTFSINAPLIEEFSLNGCSRIQGGLNLKNCIRLKTMDTRNTGIVDVTFPETSSLTSVYLSENMTTLITSNLPKLTILSLDGVTKITESTLSGIPLINTYNLVSRFSSSGGAKIDKLTITDFHWTKATPTITDYLYNIKTCNLFGQIDFTTTKDLTYDRKLKYLAKWGDIDDSENDLYITYPSDASINKIYSISLSGVRYVDEKGDYQYNMIPLNSTGIKIIYGNDFSKVEWDYIGYGAGSQDSSHNWIETKTGIFHAGLIGDEESSNYNGTIRCTLYRTDDIPLVSNYTVHLYHKKAVVGDYVFADGTYSDEIDEGRTVVGVCFYVNPENNEERLAVSTESLGGQYWGLYNDRNYMSGVTVTEDANLTSAQIYNLKNLPDISGAPLNKSTSANRNDMIRDDNFRDETTLDGFVDYKGMFSESYSKNSNSTTGKAGSMIGYTIISEDIRDDQEHPSSWAVRNEAGVFVIPSGSRVPWGYVQTLYIINHRNTILSYVITETNSDTGEILSYGLEIPSNSQDKNEWKSLIDCMDYVKNTYKDAYQEIYYPAASKCYAYDPTVFKTLKEGEELNDKLSIHNWFLPSIGDLARIYWYHRQGYDVTTENAIFAKPMSETGFTQFSSSHHWSSTEGSSNGSWNVNFSDGYINTFSYPGNGKFYSPVVRPCVAF